MIIIFLDLGLPGDDQELADDTGRRHASTLSQRPQCCPCQ